MFEQIVGLLSLKLKEEALSLRHLKNLLVYQSQQINTQSQNAYKNNLFIVKNSSTCREKTGTAFQTADGRDGGGDHYFFIFIPWPDDMNPSPVKKQLTVWALNPRLNGVITFVQWASSKYNVSQQQQQQQAAKPQG